MFSYWLDYFVLVSLVAAASTSSGFGDPLFLTPYIEAANIAEGRRLARVPFTDNLQVTSYAGFFTINKAYNSNIFLWYFPAMVSSPTAPVLVWLQGGPGSSSLFGLFAEIGPIQMRDGKFERRKYNWALNHHLIFIDNPVGVGFSFTDSPKGYRTNESQIGEDLHATIVQFFQLFPELQRNKFFVSGESYAGKYVPAFAYTIHKKNPKALLKVNLTGISIGNGIYEPESQLLHGIYLHQIGLLDYNQAQVFQSYENQIADYIKEKKIREATDLFYRLLHTDTDSTDSIFTKMTGFNNYYSYLHTKPYIPFEEPFEEMLKKADMRQGIHVGNLTFQNETKVMKDLELDWMQSVAPWLRELIDNYHVLIYSGQVDIIVPFPMTENFLRKLDFAANEEYKRAKRFFWEVDGDIAGYVKRAGNLVEIMVRNVGHMVPTDQPKIALEMISSFTSGRWNDLLNSQTVNAL